MAKRRVFVSHAGEDEDARSELYQELGRQEVSYFDYSKHYEEAEVGTTLAHRMREEIEAADLVVAIISNKSTDPKKTIVMAEIEDAIRGGFLDEDRLIGVQIRQKDRRPPSWIRLNEEDLRIKLARTPQSAALQFLEPGNGSISKSSVPLNGGGAVTAWWYDGHYFFSEEHWKLIREFEDRTLVDLLEPEIERTWFGPFSKLQSRAWAHIDKVERGCFGYIARIICRRLGQSFKPPAPIDARLPLFARLWEELGELPEYVRQVAARQIDEFQDYLAAGDWGEAIVAIRAVQNLLRQNQIDTYYPQVVEALCNFRHGSLSEAADLYQKAAASPDADENVWGGLAQVTFELGKQEATPAERDRLFTRALSESSKGIEFCAAKEERDDAPRARMDRMRMLVQVHDDTVLDPSFSAALEAELEKARGDLDFLLLFEPKPRDAEVEDHLKWEALLGMSQLIADQPHEALAIFSRMLEEPQAELSISEQSLEDFPNKMGNHFLSEVANLGIFFDEDSTLFGEFSARIHGDRDDFSVLETERGFRFVRSTDPKNAKGDSADNGSRKLPYQVFNLDGHVALRCFNLRCHLGGGIHEEAVRILEKWAIRLRNVELFRQVTVAWCAIDQQEEAWRFLNGLDSGMIAKNPQYLIDMARLSSHRNEHGNADAFSEKCRKLCIELLSASKTAHGQSVQEVIGLWGQSAALLGDGEKERAARELADGPLP